MKIIELDIEVEDVDEFNDRATELLEEYSLEISKEDGMTRPVTEDDGGDFEDFMFIWTDAGAKLVEDKHREIIDIGIKYFGDEADIDISNCYFTEP